MVQPVMPIAAKTRRRRSQEYDFEEKVGAGNGGREAGRELRQVIDHDGGRMRQKRLENLTRQHRQCDDRDPERVRLRRCRRNPCEEIMNRAKRRIISAMAMAAVDARILVSSRGGAPDRVSDTLTRTSPVVGQVARGSVAGHIHAADIDAAAVIARGWGSRTR